MKKAMLAILALAVVILAVLFYWNNPLRQEVRVLASREISTEGGEISLPDGSFVVTIPRGALSSPEKISIVEPSRIPATKVGEIVAAYEIMSKSISLDAPVTIEFKVPVRNSNDSRSIEDLYTIMFYDEENGIYVETPCTIDYSEGKISTQTNHFSIWALVSLEKYNIAHSPNFKIMFDPNSDAAGLGARNIYEFVAKVRSLLEDAYNTYVDYGFTRPKQKISVYVINTEESYYNPLTGNIIISSRSPSDNETKHEIAHELFHLFQNQDMNYLLMNKHRWWIEATADYVADKLVFNTGQMGSVIKSNYYELPLSTVDGNHEYSTALFVDWLVKRASTHGDNFKTIWRVVADNSLRHSAEESLDKYLNQRLGTTLLSEYSRFIDYLLFHGNSPLRISGDEYPQNMTSTRETLSSQSKSRLISVSVDKPYSTRVIAVRFDMPSDIRDAIFTTTQVENTSDNMVVRLFLLRDNIRRDARLLGEINRNNKLVQSRVNSKDVAYIVVSATNTPVRATLNASIIYGEIREFPISINNTYTTTIEYTLRENSLNVDVKGSVRGPILTGRTEKIQEHFGGFGAVTILVHSPSTPVDVDLNVKHRFSNGTSWVVRTSDGYIKFNIKEIQTVISHIEMLPSCTPSDRTTISLNGSSVSWSFSTRAINSTRCQPGSILDVYVSIIWKAEITSVRVYQDGSERITGTSTVEDYATVLNLEVISA